MLSSLSDKQLELLELNIVANVATISPEGMPSIHPVWVVLQDSKIYFSTKISKEKYKHLRVNPKVAISIVHPKRGTYFTGKGRAEIRTIEEYTEYEDVIERIVRKYVHDFDKASNFIEKIIDDEDRVLVEITLLDVAPKKAEH